MNKIKAKDGYRLGTRKGWHKTHVIVEGENSSGETRLKLACSLVTGLTYPEGGMLFSEEVSEAGVCKHCLRLDYVVEVIEPDAEEEQHDPDKLKVGDSVMVVKKVESHHEYMWTWVEGMDACIREVGVIDRKDDSNGFSVIMGKGDWWWFPAECLELVESAESKGVIPVAYDPKALETAQADIERLKEQLKHADEMSGKDTAEYIALQKKSEKQTAEFAECCKDLDERCQGAKVEAEKWRVEFIQASVERDKLEAKLDQLKELAKKREEEFQDSVRSVRGLIVDLREIREQRDNAINELKENIESSLMVDAQRDDAVNEKTTLKRKLKETEELYSKACMDLVELRHVTCGHEPDTIFQIMQHAPLPVDFDGQKISVDSGYKEGGEFTISIGLTPIIEYIENDAITNEMAKQQPPCESGSKRYPATLLHVSDEKVRVFTVITEKGSAAQYYQCRVKTSDLPEASE